MSVERLHEVLQPVTQWLANEAIGPELTEGLNSNFAAGSDWYQEVLSLCQQGIAEGWVCQHEQGGIKYGRVFKPSAELNNFSVDIVFMKDVVGPHHVHPQGEVDLVLPLTEGAAFDGTSEGWKVYPPESAHKPTVTGGEAFVIYFLPNGEIKFTR